MNKFLSTLVFFLLGIATMLTNNWMQNALLTQGFSWVLSYLFPWFLILLFSLASSRSLFVSLKGKLRIWLPMVAFILLPGLFFAMNPIYEGDFNKSGKPKALTENQILSDVLRFDPDFDGLVCVASPNCPYCVEAVKTKIYRIFQRAKIDALVYLGIGDEQVAAVFREKAQAPEIPVVLNTAPDDGLDIDENVIPVFLYIRKGEIVHLWRNEQLGFPALDWIEAGLPH